MKYSQDFTWKAVEHFLPEIKKARELGMCFSLPETLEQVAVKVFLSQNAYPQVYNKDNHAFEIIVVHEALVEIKEFGFIKFGDVCNF